MVDVGLPPELESSVLQRPEQGALIYVACKVSVILKREDAENLSHQLSREKILALPTLIMATENVLQTRDANMLRFHIPRMCMAYANPVWLFSQTDAVTIVSTVKMDQVAAVVGAFPLHLKVTCAGEILIVQEI